MKNWFSLFFAGAALAAGMVCSSFIISKSVLKIWQSDQIRVKGSAMRVVKSDRAQWSGSFSVRSRDLQAGYKGLESARAEIGAYLKSTGLKDHEYSFSNINIYETYKRDERGNATNQVEFHTLSPGVVADSTDVELVDRLSREFTTLISRGIFTVSNGTVFTITDLDKYKMELLAEATKNATERAEVLASNSKGKVGSLVSASQGIFQITAPSSGAISDYGEYDKSTIMKEVKSVVTLTFKVE